MASHRSVSRETVRIAVINQKGGVGKTTSAVSIAHGLALLGRRTLLIDFDSQANATISLAAEPASEPSAVSLLRDGAIPPAAPSPYPNLDYYAGTPELLKAEFELMNRGADRDKALAHSLKRLPPHYEFVILDSPPSLGLLTLNILIAVQHIIVPVQSEYLALEGVASLLRTVEEIKAQHNPALNTLGVLVTMADMRTNLAQAVDSGLRETLDDKVFETIIPRNVRVSEAPSARMTIFAYDRWSNGARAYEAVVGEILERVEKNQRKGVRR